MTGISHNKRPCYVRGALAEGYLYVCLSVMLSFLILLLVVLQRLPELCWPSSVTGRTLNRWFWLFCYRFIFTYWLLYCILIYWLSVWYIINQILDIQYPISTYFMYIFIYIYIYCKSCLKLPVLWSCKTGVQQLGTPKSKANTYEVMEKNSVSCKDNIFCSHFLLELVFSSFNYLCQYRHAD